MRVSAGFTFIMKDGVVMRIYGNYNVYCMYQDGDAIKQVADGKDIRGYACQNDTRGFVKLLPGISCYSIIRLESL